MPGAPDEALSLPILPGGQFIEPLRGARTRLESDRVDARSAEDMIDRGPHPRTSRTDRVSPGHHDVEHTDPRAEPVAPGLGGPDEPSRRETKGGVVFG